MTDWLFGTLLATSGLILLVLLLRQPVRKQFGSRIAYGLWLIPAARLFMPTLTQTAEREVAAPASVQPPLFPIGSERFAMAHVAPHQVSVVDQVGGWPNVLLAVWLTVAAGLFLSRLIAFHRGRRAILNSAEAVTRCGSVRIVRTSEIRSPVALGILHPIIAIPSDFDRLYAPRERRLVLEHELAHHRSGDLVANLFAFVLLCLQWFNPLAWVAHAAFRFDQEAACDARVLDKVNGVDRADYGRAIAKAASGRALLFASALDRPNSLHRRLESMLSTPNPRRRLAGRAMIFTAVAVALPLTASRAIEYVDKAEPASPAPATQVAPESMIAPAAVPAAPVLAAAQVETVHRAQLGGDMTLDDDWVTIDGQRKRWNELTPAEKTRVADAIAKARAALAKTHLDQAKIMRDVAAAQRIDVEKLQRDIERAHAGAADAMRAVEANSAYLRASGQDVEQIKASVRDAMQSAGRVDIQTVKRALSEVDQGKMSETLSQAEQAISQAKAELDRMDARIRAEQQR